VRAPRGAPRRARRGRTASCPRRRSQDQIARARAEPAQGVGPASASSSGPPRAPERARRARTIATTRAARPEGGGHSARRGRPAARKFRRRRRRAAARGERTGGGLRQAGERGQRTPYRAHASRSPACRIARAARWRGGPPGAAPAVEHLGDGSRGRAPRLMSRRARRPSASAGLHHLAGLQAAGADADVSDRPVQVRAHRAQVGEGARLRLVVRVGDVVPTRGPSHRCRSGVPCSDSETRKSADITRRTRKCKGHFSTSCDRAGRPRGRAWMPA